jgi:hypothetical protein
MPDNEPYGDLHPVERMTLAAVQKPGRLWAITEDVNDDRPERISDREVASILCELHRKGLVVLHRAGYWLATERGRL